MPQLTPFYFFNEVAFAFVILLSTIYTLSKYILPRFVRLFLARTFIFKFPKKYFNLASFRRHFTLVNIIMAVISLIVVGLFKYTGLALYLITLSG